MYPAAAACCTFYKHGFCIKDGNDLCNFKEVRNTSLLNKAKHENQLNFILNSGKIFHGNLAAAQRMANQEEDQTTVVEVHAWKGDLL